MIQTGHVLCMRCVIAQESALHELAGTCAVLCCAV
jgi:hypothetical protein